MLMNVTLEIPALRPPPPASPPSPQLVKPRQNTRQERDHRHDLSRRAMRIRMPHFHWTFGLYEMNVQRLSFLLGHSFFALFGGRDCSADPTTVV